jgi:hypothetical protein
MSLVPSAVVSRYLAKKAAFDFISDDRFRPPAAIAKAVQTGELPAESLNVWKYVVTKMDTHFSYAAALSHWRNKCNKMGGELTLPTKFMEGLGGAGAEGDFKVKTGEQIEDWSKEMLRSKGLLAEVGNSIHDWKLEIGHFEREMSEAQEKIDTHLKGIAEGNRVKQRQDWLEKARKAFDENQKELDRCKKALTDLETTMARYDEHKSPTIEFEKEFQFMLLLAAKDFDKKAILEAVGKAIERFEQGLDIPMATPADAPAQYQGYKSAGVLDAVSGVLSKAWDFLKSAWASLTGWIDDLMGDTKKIDDLLTRAGAPK